MPCWIRSVFALFVADARGAFGPAAALLVVVLAMASLTGVDAARLSSGRNSLQAAADSAALATASDLRLAQASTFDLADRGVRELAARLGLPPITGTTQRTSTGHQSLVATTRDAEGLALQVRVDVDPVTASVDVAATHEVVLAAGALFGRSRAIVEARSQARVWGASPLCLLSTNPVYDETIVLANRARITAPGCTVQASSSAGGFALDTTSRIEAVRTCAKATAGTQGLPVNPAPVLCPPISDPLAGAVRAFPRPDPASCTTRLTVVPVLSPVPPADPLEREMLSGEIRVPSGTAICYEQITVKAGAVLTVSGGGAIQFMARHASDPGGLFVGRGATLLTGDDGAAFVFGRNSTMKLYDGCKVQIEAPRRGPFGGYLVAEDPGNRTEYSFTVEGAGVTRLHGTIYIPVGMLRIGTDVTPNRVWPRLDVLRRNPGRSGPESVVAADSTYTVIVARRVVVTGNMRLVLNSDYARSKVPVPPGVGPSGGSVALAR